MYEERGFSRDVGFGEAPALVVIDLINAFTDPGSDFRSDLDDVVDATGRLLEGFREYDLPRYFTTVAYAVTYDDAAAEAWAREDCPRGDGRRFGPCRAIDGVVVQERAGETTVLAVAYDVTVTTDRSERVLTFVVRVVG